MQHSHHLYGSSLHVVTGHRSHIASSLIATDATELYTCYTKYCCHTKVVEVSLPKLACGVLESAEEIPRIHLEDHTCTD